MSIVKPVSARYFSKANTDTPFILLQLAAGTIRLTNPTIRWSSFSGRQGRRGYAVRCRFVTLQNPNAIGIPQNMIVLQQVRFDDLVFPAKSPIARKSPFHTLVLQGRIPNDVTDLPLFQTPDRLEKLPVRIHIVE